MPDLRVLNQRLKEALELKKLQDPQIKQPLRNVLISLQLKEKLERKGKCR